MFHGSINVAGQEGESELRKQMKLGHDITINRIFDNDKKAGTVERIERVEGV